MTIDIAATGRRARGHRGKRFARARLATTAAVLLVVAKSAAAQPAAPRIEASAGVRWLGATSFERVSATETAPSNTRLVLFDSDTSLDAALGLEARVGVRLTRTFTVETSLSYGHPRLNTRVTSDSEGIADITLSESLTQYIVEGGVVAHLARWRVGRLSPFASGGAGFLRQLHEGRQLGENGRMFYVGGGVRYPLSTRQLGLVKGSGIRADLRAAFWDGGVALDEDTHVVPSLSASFFVNF